MTTPSTPLFIQVADTLKARILDHEYAPGDSIPSARELEDEFKVSNITIRRAVELLAREGYILPRRGMRGQVAEQTRELVEIEVSGDFQTWVDTATGRRGGITSQIIERRIIDCPDPIRGILGLEPMEEVERIKRIRKLKGEPLSYYVNYGPSRYLTRLSSREIEEHSFVETYQKVCKVKLKSMEQRVRAITADMDLADVLRVEFGFPLLSVQNVYHPQTRFPAVLTQMYYRSDRYVYTLRKTL